MSGGSFLVFCLLFASAYSNSTTPVLWDHLCDAGSEVFACSIPTFMYIPGENHSRLIVTDTTITRKIRIVHAWNRYRAGHNRDNILAYDATLHALLQRPRAVEVAQSKVKTVELPPDLEYAGFMRNLVSSVIVPVQPSGAVYSLRYLDLHSNRLYSIGNLSALVNLETLVLSQNRMPHLEGEVLRRMTKLSCLNIAMNRLVTLSLDVFPPKLQMLYAHMNVIGTVQTTGSALPVLEVFSLSYGLLSELNVSAILAAAPKLKEMSLTMNQFGRELEANISATLQAAGIAHDKSLGQDGSDDYDDYHNYHLLFREENDEEDEDSFRNDHKAQLWEHIFSVLLTVVNVCVLLWGAVRFYQEKRAK